MAKVAAYVRVSSTTQTAAMQRHAIRRAAVARGDVVAGWYADTFTGGVLARPELDRLRVDVRAGKVGRLYVWRLDRLTRSGIRDTLALVDELRAHGCALVTIADGFDVAGPAADVVLAVLAWAAQMERAAIGDRIRAARARHEAKGLPWGRPSRVDTLTRAKIGTMSAAGFSVREIAVKVKVPRSTVARVLSKAATPRPSSTSSALLAATSSTSKSRSRTTPLAARSTSTRGFR